MIYHDLITPNSPADDHPRGEFVVVELGTNPPTLADTGVLAHLCFTPGLYLKGLAAPTTELLKLIKMKKEAGGSPKTQTCLTDLSKNGTIAMDYLHWPRSDTHRCLPSDRH